MNGTLDAVGFDLDYTLWDQDAFAETFLRAISPELGGRLGCGERTVERAFRDARSRLTLAHPRLFDEALLALGVEDSGLVTELVDRYRRHRPPMGLYRGAREVLEELEGRGLRLFLVTDGNSDTQRYKVAALGLEAAFSVRVYTGDFPPLLRKPSPFPFLLACRRMGLQPRRCAYVGDNPLLDFEGPQRLGMITVGVATGPFAPERVPPGVAPHLRVRSLEELAEVL